MPPMPQVKLYLVASRLTFAGWRWKKTLERTLRARLRGVSSCLTRKTERKAWVFSGSLRLCRSALAFSVNISLMARASPWTLSRRPVVLPPFGFGSSGIAWPFENFLRGQTGMSVLLHVQEGAFVAELVAAG